MIRQIILTQLSVLVFGQLCLASYWGLTSVVVAADDHKKLRRGMAAHAIGGLFFISALLMLVFAIPAEEFAILLTPSESFVIAAMLANAVIVKTVAQFESAYRYGIKLLESGLAGAFVLSIFTIAVSALLAVLLFAEGFHVLASQLS